MGNVLLNIADYIRRANPDGAIADIAEMLAQCNEVLKDMIWQEANEPMGHKVTLRAALPQGTWRGANQGVASSKSLTSQVTFGMGELVGYSIVDKSIADLWGQSAKIRMGEDMAFIEGMSQQVASAVFYSNESINPKQFTGLAPNYNTVTVTTAKSAANVIDCGGTGSANASIWLSGWGDNSVYGIYPRGSQAGLIYENKGDIVPAYDSTGARFEAYQSYFVWKLGLAIKNWQYNVRLGNIDTTTAAGGLWSSTPPDLFVYLARAVTKLPTASRRLSNITEVDAPLEPRAGINPALYCNRSVRAALDVQAIRDKNVLIRFTEYAGAPTEMFRDVPIRVCDVLTNSEARIV
ncbi:MAG: hypothetical protein KGJ90_05060 [Patescibacteria group bacterium]|nr:hypothetical protein [Patescibacteria group bacterium]